MKEERERVGPKCSGRRKGWRLKKERMRDSENTTLDLKPSRLAIQPSMGPGVCKST
jgi:hypothetical protein